MQVTRSSAHSRITHGVTTRRQGSLEPLHSCLPRVVKSYCAAGRVLIAQTVFLAPGLSYTTKGETWLAVTLVTSCHTQLSQDATSLCSNSIQFGEY